MTVGDSDGLISSPPCTYTFSLFSKPYKLAVDFDSPGYVTTPLILMPITSNLHN